MTGTSFSKENANLIYGNGVDGATGQLLLSGVDADAFAESLLTREADELTVRLATISEAQKAGRLALPFPAREDDLTTTGWGVVFARGIGQDAKEALQPLIEHRCATTKNKVKIFYGEEDGFKPSETAPQFIDRHGADSRTVIVDKVPYYMLLVGDPEAIPYREQRYFTTQYAVGRLDLDCPSAYRNYANAVVAHERKLSGAPLLELFGPLNRGDRSTSTSLNYLISPLANADFFRPDLERRIFQADEATKHALTGFFARADRPRVIVTATHGVALAPDHPDQDAIQGALLCQDWPGPEVKMPVEKEHRFAAADVDSNVDVTGAFLFLYACFSGGTPRQDEFWFAEKNTVDIKTLAKRAFTAKLVRRLLGHTNPPVAIMAHCDRAWGASFYRPSSAQHGAMFIASLRGVLAGLPLGAAFAPINTAAASLSAELREQIANREVIVDKAAFLQQWVAERDARGYCLFGDPAVRLVAPLSSSTGE